MVSSALPATSGAGEWVPGELIVKFRASVAPSEKSSLVNGQLLERLDFTGAELWRIADGGSVTASASALAADARIEYAEPNYLLRTLETLETPDDPLFSQMWNLHNTGQTVGGVVGVPDADIDAVEAWDVFTGASSVVVAVIDTGVDYLHPDLAANIWTNAGEVPGNGLDDDGNGFIDDIRGWDFGNGDNNPMDDTSHGTHCSGTIGAVADNGLGIVGVNWNVGIMPLRFVTDGSTGTTADAIAAIGYAVKMGVDVISCSWGNRIPSASLLDAIRGADEADIFFVAAAGNEGDNNDYMPFYPSGYDVDNVIAVMATDNRDQRAIETGWASNYGAAAVDIAAPGVRIWSTIRGGGYMYLSGTSMATPHVAGALALLRGRYPGISVAAGRARLLTIGNDPLASLSGLCVSGGRLNLRKLIADPDTIPPSAVTDLAAGEVASNWLTLSWTAPGDDSAVQGYEVRYSTGPLVDESDWSGAERAPNAPTPAVPGTPLTMRVGALQASTTYHLCLRARDEYGNLGDFSNSLVVATLAAPTISVTPAALTAPVRPGDTATRTLTIANAGAGVLDVSIPGNVPSAGSLDLRAIPQGAGGPDDFGYHWTDSDTPGGPAFNWIDITRTGIAISPAAGTSEGPLPIGFPFPFYDGAFESFHIDPLGYITLTPGASSAGNTALPSAAAPAHLIALLWDDLVQGDGACHYLSDGERLIVQYSDWVSSATGGLQTMQIHLYAGGVVEFQYLDMSPAASVTATIGIQDGTGTRGLTVSANALYVHDNLAIRFARLPRWLSVSPAVAHLAGGASLDVAVTFDANGLCGNGHAATLHVLSNDPNSPDAAVPVTLTLIGAQDIVTDPAGLAFDAVFVARTATRNLVVANPGCSDLTISGLEFDSALFTSPQVLPLVVPAGTTRAVPVVFAPTALGPVSARLTIVSDDPDEPQRAVPLTGAGLAAPRIVVAPTALADTLMPGGSSTRQLLVTNHGTGSLQFTIPEGEYIPQSPGPDGFAAIVNDASGSGGPDAYGYHWLDSDAPYGPAFDWVEIANVGTRIPFSTSEETLGPFDLGFAFGFYGGAFTQFSVCSNGWISFTERTNFAQVNRALPSLVAPRNMVAPFWDDLDFTGGRGSAWYRYDGQRLIVEYKDVPRLGSAGTGTFQIHLYPSGRIEFHYLTLSFPVDNATVGLQNGTGTVGVTAVNNVAYLHDGLAIRFDSVRPWLSAEPASGTVAPGGSAAVTVRFDAEGLCDNVLLANLHLLSNDPDSPDLAIPVTLLVPPAALARISSTSLAFGNVVIPASSTFSVDLADSGCATLQVTGATIDNPAFRADASAPFDVEPGATRVINVTFTPSAEGPVTGTMTLTTNDPGRSELTVLLTGTGVRPAGVLVTPAGISAALGADETGSAVIHVENTGGDALEFRVPAPELHNKSGIVPAGTLGQGGADAFGYRWRDSDAEGGPVFDWIDISDTGTPALTSGDDITSAPLPIGFPFSFYGRLFTTFQVCSNGWLSFSSLGTDHANRELPSVLAPRNLVAPFWDDLDLDAEGSGDIRFRNVDEGLIVQWSSVMRRETTIPVTFQIILRPSGAIVFQYLTVGEADTGSATVGIQNAAGTVGLQVVRDAAYIHDNLAVWFSSVPEWATVAPASGTIPAGGSLDLTVTLNSARLGAGTHLGVMHLLSNDPLNPDLAIPLSLDVQSAEPEAAPTVLSLAQNAPNPFRRETLLRVGNPASGTVELMIFDIRGALVRTLASGPLDAAFFDYVWDGRADDGGQVPSGVYFCRLRSGRGEVTRRMILVK